MTFLLTACGIILPINAPFVPPSGIVYTNYKAPLSTKFNNKEAAQAEGEANVTYGAFYIFSVGIGDASLKQAMSDGVIQNASYADYELLNFLGIVSKVKVNVYGTEEKY